MTSLAPAKQSNNVGTWDSFFHYYGMIVHQQNMLHDRVRTGTYKTAFDQNKIDFDNEYNAALEYYYFEREHDK